MITVIESMTADGRGLAHIDDRPVWIHGALPGEGVSFVYTRVSRKRDEGRAEQVLDAAADRVIPHCELFGICGGCSLQHQDPTAQILAKQQSLLDAFSRSGGLTPREILEPLKADQPWGYRTKARLGVKYVEKKGRVLVGFRERGSGFITETQVCPVLDGRVARLHGPLGELIFGLSIRDRIPQIEIAMGDAACVLIFRVLDAPSKSDISSLEAFGVAHQVYPYLQTGGPDTVCSLSANAPELSYTLPDHDLRMRFQPGDFTQVNQDMNRLMVNRAIDLLAPGSGDRILDLFCGLGNFTLPLAQRALEVTGIEGDAGLVARARENARDNRIGNARFYSADLYGDLGQESWMSEPFDLALLDPPRSGALEVLERLAGLGVTRILYISCNPETLARDAAELVNRHGYGLVSAGVMDMFPHTHHVESVALFERQPLADGGPVLF